MDEFLPLRDVVFNTLRRAILTGELEPGERLASRARLTSSTSCRLFSVICATSAPRLGIMDATEGKTPIRKRKMRHRRRTEFSAASLQEKERKLLDRYVCTGAQMGAQDGASLKVTSFHFIKVTAQPFQQPALYFNIFRLR